MRNLKGARILVVDDADRVRVVMAEMLRVAGADVAEAVSGEEALGLAAGWRPDLVVLDLDLPDLDGVEVCRRIKSDPATGSTLVLLLSGVFLDVADRVRGLEGGADGFLTKPVERMELMATAAALLRLHDSERRRRAAETVARVAQALTETLDVSAVANRIVESLPALFDLRTATVRLLQPDGSLLTVASGGPACEHYEVGHVCPPGTGAAGWAIAEGGAVWAADLLAEPRIRLTDEQRQRAVASASRAIVAVPLRVKGQLLGAISLAEETSRTFSDADVALLQTFADQAALAIENARLYEDARRAYRELSEAQHQLRQSQKMEAIGRLASGVAHDFNNLLTVIRGRSELLRARLAADDPLYRHARLIETTAERAGALTHQLLAFSRKQVLQPKVLDLNQVLGGMEKMLRRLIGEDIDLIFAMDPALDRVRADPAQLEQVILNLVVNARDAMPHGGRLVVETSNLRVDGEPGGEAPGLQPGTHVMLAVGDSGVGMDEETQSHVFEPFFTTKEPGTGTGLGLATVYGIVKQSGGEVAFESEVDRGTTFRIYLPGVQEPAESVAASLPQVSAPRGIETILLVEDDDALREMTREMLALYGYRVIDARHPGEALLVAERRPDRIDLLVTDIVMPQMNGCELAERLVELRPNLRVLYMSGYADETVIRRAGVNGALTLLQKPFAAGTLAHKVREALDAAPRLTGARR
ncbi:MAG TPA: response regulator [Methylomirabilota bacterium]|jgi:signal transduction histidine kinase|nr:response regulator [Methylomirabilota bacterium]